MTSDLIDTKKEDKAKVKDKKRRIRQLGDIKKILSMPEGRRFFWRMLSKTGMYKTSFTGNSTTFMLEGKRQIGLFILNEMMSADNTAFAQMQQEFFSEATSEELLRQKEEKE